MARLDLRSVSIYFHLQPMIVAVRLYIVEREFQDVNVLRSIHQALSPESRSLLLMKERPTGPVGEFRQWILRSLERSAADIRLVLARASAP